MQTETLEIQIIEIDGKLADIDRLTSENVAAVATAEARTEKAKGRLAELTSEKEEVRVDRQTALAAGKDAKATGQRLKAIQDVTEDLEDEIARLSARLEQLRAQGTQLRAERAATVRLIPVSKLRDAARRYNTQAAALVPVLGELWRLRAELGEPREGRAVQTPLGPVGALECLPRLFIPGEEGFLDVGDPEKHFFFDGPGLKEKRAQRVRPLRVDEDPPAPMAPSAGVSEGGGRS